jgi:hypothetical protein
VEEAVARAGVLGQPGREDGVAVAVVQDPAGSPAIVVLAGGGVPLGDAQAVAVVGRAEQGGAGGVILDLAQAVGAVPEELQLLDRSAD